MSIKVSVDGITNSYGFEYTTQDTSTYYYNAASTLLLIGNKSLASISNADLNDYNQALNQLKSLALGYIPGSTTQLNTPITAQMAKAIDSLIAATQTINSFAGTPLATLTNSVGLNSNGELLRWKDLYVAGLDKVLSSAVRHGGDMSTSTLQSYIQLHYIEGGNKALFNQLSSLQEAMTATNQALMILGDIQSLKNRAVVKAPVGASYTNMLTNFNAGQRLTLKGRNWVNTQINVTSVLNAYKNNFNNTLGNRLLINVDPAFSASIEAQGTALVNQLREVIAQLNQINPSGANETTSLQARCQALITDMTQTPANVLGNTSRGVSIHWWILDNYNDDKSTALITVASTDPPYFQKESFNVANAGNYQRNLTNAITTAQSLNNSQKADLQTSIFTFQEFYQSSSAILSMINHLMQTISGGISKG